MSYIGTVYCICGKRKLREWKRKLINQHCKQQQENDETKKKENYRNEKVEVD